jgi:hypothetical protein
MRLNSSMAGIFHLRMDHQQNSDPPGIQPNLSGMPIVMGEARTASSLYLALSNLPAPCFVVVDDNASCSNSISLFLNQMFKFVGVAYPLCNVC